MGPESNDWNEYRLMILDWHNQDIAERDKTRAQLTAIQTTLTEMQTRRTHRLTVLNLAVPAAVALVVMGLQIVAKLVWFK